MGKKEQEFFFERQLEHSKAKLALLKNYALVWMRKVTLGTPERRCLIIDTFAGAGYYEDGSEGSPILLIKEAMNFAEQSKCFKTSKFNNITLIFSEKNKETFIKLKENIENLINQKIVSEKFNVLNKYNNIEIAITNDSFENFVNNLLAKIDNIIPTLMFIDPFGYKNISLDIISKLIQQYDNCELLINFMYEEFNRFLFKEDNKNFVETQKGFYGNNLSEIQEKIKNSCSTPKERREIIISGYKENLKNAGADYILDFDIEKNNKVKMTMVFCTRNLYGFDVMKENMFKTCKNTDFEYHTTSPQLSLFSDCDEDKIVSELAGYIYNKFSGKKVMTTRIKDYCMKHQYIPSSFYKKALKLLEKSDKIISVNKINEEKRRKGTFPDDCFVIFKEV